MKLLKKINNNYVLALDSKGEQIIVEGKGIGFKKMPCDLTDLSQISKTYYDTKEQDIYLIQSISNEILAISSKVFDYASTRIASKLNPNLTFILADHIQFCIERFEKHIDIKMPIYYDIEHLYPKESDIADYTIKLIYSELKILLPESEKTGIALNIINSEVNLKSNKENKDELIALCTSIVEDIMNVKINKDSFSYSRFVTHLEYLLRRVKTISNTSLENLKLYTSISKEFPNINICVNKVSNLLNKNEYYLNEEEKLYLMLHVNRLCNREDCNR